MTNFVEKYRPPVCGMSGRANLPAPSIVMSGGYEDDIDNGEVNAFTLICSLAKPSYCGFRSSSTLGVVEES